jgi:hypothetical protein
MTRRFNGINRAGGLHGFHGFWFAGELDLFEKVVQPNS